MKPRSLSSHGTAAWALAWILITTIPARPDTLHGDAYRESIEAWRRERLARLTSEDGWLTLAGLYWLEEGENRFGSDPASDLVFPDEAPARVGHFLLEKEKVTVEAEEEGGVLHEGRPVRQMELATDAEGEPTILTLGDLSFYLIERQGRWAIRLKDKNHPARTAFPGIESYPVDSAWRLTGHFEPYDPPRKIPIPTILGTVAEQTSWGKVSFEVDGQRHRLDVLAEPGDEQLFIIFADRTTGSVTYGGGRYLTADAPSAEGTVVLDFNKAYNPPCVFTPFATCPLPPRQNRLALRVEAGEKYTRKH
jgi:uncharacterized protein (DUF1684 family)